MYDLRFLFINNTELHDNSTGYAALCGGHRRMQEAAICQVLSLIPPQFQILTTFRYFSTSSSLSMSAWATTEADAHARCGHCDNCTRPPESIERRDVTLEAWQILQVAQAIERDGGRVTLSMLADLVRGAGGGVYGVGGGKRGKGKAKEKVGLDLAEIAGGKITLSKDVGHLASPYVTSS